MKKALYFLPYLLVIILIFIISLLLTTNKPQNKSEPQKNSDVLNNTIVRTFNGKPVASIDIETFIIYNFCRASTGDFNSTWDYDKIQRSPKPNINNNNYVCFVKDKQANKELFGRQFDKQIGFTPSSICNKIFNQEFFSGHATDDQYACTFVAK